MMMSEEDMQKTKQLAEAFREIIRAEPDRFRIYARARLALQIVDLELQEAQL